MSYEPEETLLLFTGLIAVSHLTGVVDLGVIYGDLGPVFQQLLLLWVGTALFIVLSTVIREAPVSFLDLAAKVVRAPELTVGRRRRVVEVDSETGYCVNCGMAAGIERVAREETIVFGARVQSRETARVPVCQPCREADMIEYAVRAGTMGRVAEATVVEYPDGSELEGGTA